MIKTVHSKKHITLLLPSPVVIKRIMDYSLSFDLKKKIIKN